MVLRNVAKAFDKVWHDGLKYKVLRLQFPEILKKKILCKFLDSRTAKINIGKKYSRDFTLFGGVPQGSVLSLTLFCLQMTIPHQNMDACTICTMAM